MMDKPSILTVEDDFVARLAIRYMMEQEGYQVLEAHNGHECLAMCQSKLPDIVLLDACMPGMDGFQCCGQLQLAYGDNCPPILMVTSLEDDGSIERAFALGATDYVTKPISWVVLRQRVRRLIQTGQAMRELRRLVLLDDLTQIANRRSFDEHLRQEWRRLAREQLPISLILCDIDYFKSYNDYYGHQAGDACLKQVAFILSQSLRRPADLVARYGGEEFAAILPSTFLEGGIHVARSIQKMLAVQRIEHLGAGSVPYLTLSLGVASAIPQSKGLAEDLIRVADQALYQAKSAGRNRVISVWMEQDGLGRVTTLPGSVPEFSPNF